MESVVVNSQCSMCKYLVFRYAVDHVVPNCICPSRKIMREKNRDVCLSHETVGAVTSARTVRDAIDEPCDVLGDWKCNPEETDTIVCHDGDKTIMIHVMECDRCGGEYEHVNGDYEYCPRCRAKIEGDGK